MWVKDGGRGAKDCYEAQSEYVQEFDQDREVEKKDIDCPLPNPGVYVSSYGYKRLRR